MSRPLAHFYIVVLILSFVAFLVSGCSGSDTAQEEEGTETPAAQSNIVFILTDDLDYASAFMTTTTA